MPLAASSSRILANRYQLSDSSRTIAVNTCASLKRPCSLAVSEFGFGRDALRPRPAIADQIVISKAFARKDR